MKAKLILENGRVFQGNAFGHLKETIGEVVFDTNMGGYQEILTDPANYGNIVVMTYPLIGNYGINLDDSQSDGIRVRGLVVREKCVLPNNWRCEFELDDYLRMNKVIGIEGIDTRELTRVIRDEGIMKGIITVRELSHSQIQTHFNSFNNQLSPLVVTSKEVRNIGGSGKKIAVIDLGVRKENLDFFVKYGYSVTVLPASVTADEINGVNPDGVFISSGPGNPAELQQIVSEISKINKVIPIFGVGMGSVVLAQVYGAEVDRLGYGHQGSNQPVKDIGTGKVLITNQNHTYIIKDNDFNDEINITHRNINDNSIEGFRHMRYPSIGITFQPKDISDYKVFINLVDSLNGKEK